MLNDLCFFEFWPIHCHLQGFQDKSIKLNSKRYRTWSNHRGVYAALVLHWWQSLSISAPNTTLRSNRQCKWCDSVYAVFLHCFKIPFLVNSKFSWKFLWWLKYPYVSESKILQTSHVTNRCIFRIRITQKLCGNVLTLKKMTICQIVMPYLNFIGW